jgi:hypothetical protein
VGLDISTFGVRRGANPFTEGLGPMKYAPRSAGFGEGSKTIKRTPEVTARGIKAMVRSGAIKPVRVSKGRKNIFMQ